jgi:hypothetical protein
MTVAFVLSGGASLGAIQVGMLKALAAREIRPDLIVGTSVGAVNGAFIASRPFEPASVDELAELWLGIRRARVFPVGRPDVVVVPAPCPVHVSPIDFGHTRELIDRAEVAAGDFLAGREADVVPIRAMTAGKQF